MALTNSGKLLSIRMAPTSVLTAPTREQSSAMRPAAILPISMAYGAVCRAAMPAAIMATGGMVGCERWRTISPM